jgi:hypothetical protein
LRACAKNAHLTEWAHAQPSDTYTYTHTRTFASACTSANTVVGAVIHTARVLTLRAAAFVFV